MVPWSVKGVDVHGMLPVGKSMQIIPMKAAAAGAYALGVGGIDHGQWRAWLARLRPGTLFGLA